jgi:hypothetical protein
MLADGVSRIAWERAAAAVAGSSSGLHPPAYQIQPPSHGATRDRRAASDAERRNPPPAQPLAPSTAPGARAKAFADVLRMLERMATEAAEEAHVRVMLGLFPTDDALRGHLNDVVGKHQVAAFKAFEDSSTPAELHLMMEAVRVAFRKRLWQLVAVSHSGGRA